MEKNEALSADVAAEVERTMPEDAKRLRDIIHEASEIIKRNKWNGIAKCIAETSEETNGCFGFTQIHDPVKLLSAGLDGLSVLQGAKAIKV